MRILAIETASPPGSIALLDGMKIVQMDWLESPQKTTQQFASLIRSQLSSASWSPADIRLVVTTDGPGSFTGLRIGVTTAKVFAYAVGAQVVGVNTLDVIASQCPADEREMEVVLDAQRQQLFAARYRKRNGNVECLEPTRIIDVEDWLATRAATAVLTGTGLKRLQHRLADEWSVTDERHWRPQADTLGVLAVAAAERGDHQAPVELTPRYYRKSAAEEKLGKS